MGHIEELQGLFGGAASSLPPEVLGELQSILRLHSTSAQELFYKWESYSIKMGAEDTSLDLKTARDFKKDLEEQLERETRGKAEVRKTERRVAPTPRAGAVGGDVFGILDGMIPNTPQSASLGRLNSTTKRKSNFETPAAKRSSPTTPATATSAAPVSFASRQNAGEVIESINEHIAVPTPSDTRTTESRIKFKALTDMAKMNYKSMAMKLSTASEILDDRIDEFVSIIADGHKLDESAFGNPAAQSTSEVVAMGRIASDSPGGRLNVNSLVLETSRRNGSGLRVPLKVDGMHSYDLFPGKIVALRGTNASGEFFAVTEELAVPPMKYAVSTSNDLAEHLARMQSLPSDPEAMTDGATRPLSCLVAAGPYTSQESLDFSPLHELLTQALATQADMLVLTGPFLDVEHPCIRHGDTPLPESFPVQPDQATLNDVFRYHITTPLIQFSKQLPGCSVLLVPSVREATSKAVSWPQDRMNREALGLRGHKSIRLVSDPTSLSVNEALWGISSLDVLDQIRASECVGGKAKQENIFVRCLKGVIGQRHFMPVYPPLEQVNLDGEATAEDEEYQQTSMGAMLDIPYLKLGEWWNVRPDLLVLPSILTPFVKVDGPFHWIVEDLG